MIHSDAKAVEEHDYHAIHKEIQSIEEAWCMLVSLACVAFVDKNGVVSDLLVEDGCEDVHGVLLC